MRRYTNNYNSRDYDPPAPMAEIGIAKVGARQPSAQLVALIDSGADATMLPIDTLQTVAARYLTTRRMIDAAGHATTVETYLVTVFIGPFIFRGIEAIAAAAGSEALIGRDALNQMVVNLNGLANVVEMSQQ